MAVERLAEHAQAMGADAVIAMRFDSGEVGADRVGEIIAYLRPWLVSVAANEARKLVHNRHRRAIAEIVLRNLDDAASDPSAEIDRLLIRDLETGAVLFTSHVTDPSVGKGG